MDPEEASWRSIGGSALEMTDGHREVQCPPGAIRGGLFYVLMNPERLSCDQAVLVITDSKQREGYTSACLIAKLGKVEGYHHAKDICTRVTGWRRWRLGGSRLVSIICHCAIA
jgi:hypothetical protein